MTSPARRRLAENELEPWQQKMWCIPEVDGTYVARMEDVLDLYAEAPDPKRPVVCFDESLAQLIGETRQPIPAGPGKPRRYDYEYCRNGTVNRLRRWPRARVALGTQDACQLWRFDPGATKQVSGHPHHEERCPDMAKPRRGRSILE